MTAHTPSGEAFPALQRNAMNVFAPLQREFNRFFEDLGDGGVFHEPQFMPRMDLIETKSGLELTVEAPGLGPEDLKITADGEVLTISGEKSAAGSRLEGEARLAERSFGRFSRSVTLPRSVDAGASAATMKDGVLKIDIPKRPGAKTQTIAIETK